MSERQTAATGELTRAVSDTRAVAWWGMMLAVFAQAVLLAALVVAYISLGVAAAAWPPAEIGRPALLVPLVGTVLLLASGVPMVWASVGIRQGRQSALRLGLVASFVLGAAFLGVAVYQYTRQEFDLSTHAYSSAFLTITAVHAVQVAAALVMSALVQLWAWLGAYDARRHLAVRNVALNWYCVIGSWIVVFAVLYLSPYVFR